MELEQKKKRVIYSDLKLNKIITDCEMRKRQEIINILADELATTKEQLIELSKSHKELQEQFLRLVKWIQSEVDKQKEVIHKEENELVN